MTKYVVSGYVTTNYSIEVEANTTEEAEEIGTDALMSGNGLSTSSDWLDEFEIRKVNK